jgi:hypothetical protein
MELRVLNESQPNVLPYLPYGVTTIEMRLDGNSEETFGFIHPKNRADAKHKMYFGYADDSEDFIVLWGGGYEDGLNINWQNFEGRLFLQVLHKGKRVAYPNLTLYHERMNDPIVTLKLVPADICPDLVTMELMKDDASKSYLLSFKGNKLPSYYSRWFPPRPSENNRIKYYQVSAPQITVSFKFRKNSPFSIIDSDIDIFLENTKIAQVSGDWRFSWPHAELFTVFGDAQYFVLRLWLYWVNGMFSKLSLSNGKDHGDRLPEAGSRDKSFDNNQISNTFWEAFDIECPDIERFDFLIDMEKKKVTWLGTDFHYQELWYKFEDKEPFVRARIAYPLNTIEQILRRIQNRLNPPDNSFDPMMLLRNVLKKHIAGKSLTQVDMHGVRELLMPKMSKKEISVKKGVGFTRKHLPYAENGKLVTELMSSVVTS